MVQVRQLGVKAVDLESARLHRQVSTGQFLEPKWGVPMTALPHTVQIFKDNAPRSYDYLLFYRSYLYCRPSFEEHCLLSTALVPNAMVVILSKSTARHLIERLNFNGNVRDRWAASRIAGALTTVGTRPQLANAARTREAETLDCSSLPKPGDSSGPIGRVRLLRSFRWRRHSFRKEL